MNLNQLLQAASTQLEAAGLAYGHGTTNAHDEAVWLTLWQLGLPLDSALDELAERACSEAEVAAVHPQNPKTPLTSIYKLFMFSHFALKILSK